MDELCGKGTAKFGRIRTVEKLSRDKREVNPWDDGFHFQRGACVLELCTGSTNPPSLLRSFLLFKPLRSTSFFLSLVRGP